MEKIVYSIYSKYLQFIKPIQGCILFIVSDPDLCRSGVREYSFDIDTLTVLQIFLNPPSSSVGMCNVHRVVEFTSVPLTHTHRHFVVE